MLTEIFAGGAVATAAGSVADTVAGVRGAVGSVSAQLWQWLFAAVVTPLLALVETAGALAQARPRPAAAFCGHILRTHPEAASRGRILRPHPAATSCGHILQARGPEALTRAGNPPETRSGAPRSPPGRGHARSHSMAVCDQMLRSYAMSARPASASSEIRSDQITHPASAPTSLPPPRLPASPIAPIPASRTPVRRPKP